ncbi:MAG: trehalose-phosphatase [Beijerinckiaceae bacterium]
MSDSSALALPPPPAVLPDSASLFLDFDGTLVDFAAHPDEVVLPIRVRDDVARIGLKLGGALAIVSGRRIEDIDRFFAPLILPVAGVHGLFRRDSGGVLHSADFDAKALENLAGRLRGFTATEPGLLLERKPGSVAVHYRLRPELAAVCAEALVAAVGETGASGLFHVMHGKMVVEARASDMTKASAIAAFMREAPFAGRVPVFAGDDVTDEDGFREVETLGGVTIKVGTGTTLARYRVGSIGEFRDWLHHLAEQAA